MADYCLIGKRLDYSYSKVVHNKLGYDYDLTEVKEEDLASFIRSHRYKAFNVTIPYKKAVIPFLDEISPEAAALGVVNLVMEEGGKLKGYNMDIRGMEYALKKTGLSLREKKVVILGSGNTSQTAEYLAREAGAATIVKVSRGGEENYQTVGRHKDAAYLINTTPVGTYPANEDELIDLSLFPALEGVQEVIYNPFKTRLALQAEERGLPVATGLDMLVGQAAYTAEKFRGELPPVEKVDAIVKEILWEERNIVLIGMPSCGKSTVGRALAQMLNRPFVDSDDEIVKRYGAIPEIFAKQGEDAFRTYESEVIAEVTKRHGAVIATGGGAVERKRNVLNMRQNGVIAYLTRAMSSLSDEGRPLSQGGKIAALYERRAPLYEGAADVVVSNDGSLQQTVESLLLEVKKL